VCVYINLYSYADDLTMSVKIFVHEKAEKMPSNRVMEHELKRCLLLLV